MRCVGELGNRWSTLVAAAAFIAAGMLTGCDPPGAALNPPAAPPGAPQPPLPPGAPKPPPPPGAPSAAAAGDALEAAWGELIAVHEAHFKKLASIHNAAQAEAAFDDAVAFQRQKKAALVKIAALGGEAPPIGVPKELRAQYKDVQNRVYARDEVVSQMLTPEQRERFTARLQETLLADPEFIQDPFQLSAAIRGASTRATITLINNKSLAGDAHQQMIAALRELAGATNAQSVIEPDGTYKLVLAPVADFNRLVTGIRFGIVSNRDDAQQSFTLTIDPQRFQAASAGPGTIQAAAGGAGGPSGVPTRFPGGRGGGNPDQQMEARKADFIAKTGGANRCVTLILDGAPDSGTPEYGALLERIKQTTGATSSMGLRINGRRQLLLAPVEDFSAVAAKLTFGTIKAQDPATREIFIVVEPASSSP
jgi:hypothetical protein